MFQLGWNANFAPHVLSSTLRVEDDIQLGLADASEETREAARFLVNYTDTSALVRLKRRGNAVWDLCDKSEPGSE